MDAEDVLRDRGTMAAPGCSPPSGDLQAKLLVKREYLFVYL
jgi:hypothetical protein